MALQRNHGKPYTRNFSGCRSKRFEKRMFSGLSFLIEGKLCVSVAGMDRILVRLSPEDFQTSLEQNGVDTMQRNGKPLKGYIYVDNNILKNEKDLKRWVDMALAYNPIAKSSKQ